MVQALGGRFLDIDGNELPKCGGGKDLLKMQSIDLSELDKRLQDIEIEVACNWRSVL